MAIHADWPAYPGQGTGDALYDLCQFPHGTTFRSIDDIDRCVLFVASDQAPHADVWSKNAFHIAVWHSDLIELADEIFVQPSNLSATSSLTGLVTFLAIDRWLC
jgi:hypothetical protein